MSGQLTCCHEVEVYRCKYFIDALVVVRLFPYVQYYKLLLYYNQQYIVNIFVYFRMIISI
jgi:hypothetical protein